LRHDRRTDDERPIKRCCISSIDITTNYNCKQYKENNNKQQTTNNNKLQTTNNKQPGTTATQQNQKKKVSFLAFVLKIKIGIKVNKKIFIFLK
jgi:hypothetical protein